jgi:hypothetical protein
VKGERDKLLHENGQLRLRIEKLEKRTGILENG